MRTTSLNVYRAIEDSGVLGGLQWAVYAHIFKHGPLTQNELFRYYFPNVITDSIKPRFSELLAMGCIKEVGSRACQVTGNEALIWDVTEHVPATKFKRKSKYKELKAELEETKAMLDVFMDRFPSLNVLEDIALRVKSECLCQDCNHQQAADWIIRIVKGVRG